MFVESPSRSTFACIGSTEKPLNHSTMNNSTPEQNFNALGLGLPPAPVAMGVYKPCLQDGKYLYVSGHGPVRDDTTLITGRIGQELDADQGKLAARQVGLAILATVRGHLGSLDRIRRVIKTLGMVSCTSDFDPE